MGSDRLPDGWRCYPLRDPRVCVLNPPKREVRDRPDSTKVTFVPMAAVDDESGSIVAAETREIGQVRKGYTYFAENDVVFAKITPCMENGKAAIGRGLVNGIGFGTTEFHVLRAGPQVIPEWLHAFVRRADIRAAAKKNMHGAAGQQRVPVEFLEQLEMPVPPTQDEQRRIVARIEELTARLGQARRHHCDAATAVSQLFQAGLESAFNERNTAEWPTYQSNSLFSPVAGQVDPREEPYVDLPHVGPDSIESGTARLLRDTIQTPRQLGLKSGKYLFGPEHVLYSKIRPALRKVALPDFAGVCSADMYPLLPNTELISREFLALSLLSPPFSRYAVDNSDRNAMPKINRTVLNAYQMPVPDQETQAAIVRELFGLKERAEQLAAMQADLAAELESFTPALLAKAFRGEL